MQGGVYLLFLLTMFSNLFPMTVETIGRFLKIEEVTVIAEEIEIEKPKSLQISLVGDLLMDGSIRWQIDKNGGDYPWEMVKEYFLNDDITIGNLETSITTRASKWPDKLFNLFLEQ